MKALSVSQDKESLNLFIAKLQLQAELRPGDEVSDARTATSHLYRMFRDVRAKVILTRGRMPIWQRLGSISFGRFIGQNHALFTTPRTQKRLTRNGLAVDGLQVTGDGCVACISSKTPESPQQDPDRLSSARALHLKPHTTLPSKHKELKLQQRCHLSPHLLSTLRRTVSLIIYVAWLVPDSKTTPLSRQSSPHKTSGKTPWPLVCDSRISVDNPPSVILQKLPLSCLLILTSLQGLDSISLHCNTK